MGRGARLRRFEAGKSPRLTATKPVVGARLVSVTLKDTGRWPIGARPTGKDLLVKIIPMKCLHRPSSVLTCWTCYPELVGKGKLCPLRARRVFNAGMRQVSFSAGHLATGIGGGRLLARQPRGGLSWLVKSNCGCNKPDSF